MNQYPIIVTFHGQQALITFFGSDYDEALEAARQFEEDHK